MGSVPGGDCAASKKAVLQASNLSYRFVLVNPQFEVVTPHGRFRADFAYPEAGLLIEAHSMKFHGGTPVEDRDMRRHLALVAAGFEVVYVTASMLGEPASWLPGVVETYRRGIVTAAVRRTAL